MTRKQRNWTFWILVFSLNLIPLVAQGGPKPTGHVTSKKAKLPKAATPSGSPQPAPSLTPPAAPSEAKDLTISDLTGANAQVMDFDAHKDDQGDPDSSAKLLGRFYNDCKPLIKITYSDKTNCAIIDSKGETTLKNAATFQIQDLGGFSQCMSDHKKKALCTDSTCSFFSSLPNATHSLSGAGTGPVMLLHHDPQANEQHGNLCQNFPTAMSFKNATSFADDASNLRSTTEAARLEVAQNQVKSCVHSEAELKTAYHACSVLALLGEYKSQSECVADEKLDQHGIDILKSKASHASPEELDGVANQLINWANKHPKECKKAIEPLHTIAKRLATQKVKRARKDEDSDSASDPLAGYDAANDVLENAIDGASCLDADGKLSEMQENLQINRTEKLGEIKGMYSMEYQQGYSDLMSGIQSNMTDNCNSWEMDTSCSAATKDMQSAMTVGQMVNAANMKTAQSNAALCQMVMRSSNGMMAPPQCQQSTMGGMNGMMGMNGFGYGNIGSSSYGFGRL